ncbi:MAG: polyphosphate kinase 1 [Acidobacteriaceae bacterium]|jgi:polyphosphate kinase|nr:polyphosphate kinase 1 [Acidobacteriaceae bacterium]
MRKKAQNRRPSLASITHDGPKGLSDPALYINRELSWLAFNERVLAQASDPKAHPLLERVKFLAIAANNLDEFFMVRLATVLRAYRSGTEEISADGLDPEEQLTAMRERSSRFLHDLHHCWEQVLRPELAAEHITVLDRAEYSNAVRQYLARRFNADIAPVLTPLAFDPGHPFPYMSNRSKNLAVVVRQGRQRRFARVKVPDTLPRFVEVPPHISDRPGVTFAMLEDIMAENAQALFPGVDVMSADLFRIMRDTDIVLAISEEEDLRESVDRSLKQLRHGAVTMLQVDNRMPKRVLEILRENFEVDDTIVHACPGRMAFADWMQLASLHRPRLKDAPFVPRSLWAASDVEHVFENIAEEDHLVHHPFDSFTAVETFLQAAVRDPLVVAIKMTLYRLEPNSPLIELLLEAAVQGKQVAVLVELKARFDERSNIAWATRLEAAGIHVVYGMVHLKTHCKLCLVIRQEPSGIRRYAHIGTGNYNRKTAAVYTDFGLFTAREAIVADVSDVFNYLTGYSAQTTYRELLVAPVNMRARLTELVAREAAHARAGRPAYLLFKMNAISDPAFIRVLYQACRDGVTVDLIARGICCARPGVDGVSERMTVRSIVGRFLEHTRLYFFENGGNPEMYLGSADLMERNLNRRVEVLCPVENTEIKAELRAILDTYLRDNSRAHRLTPEGFYEPLAPKTPETVPFSAQDALLAALALEPRERTEIVEPIHVSAAAEPLELSGRESREE